MSHGTSRALKRQWLILRKLDHSVTEPQLMEMFQITRRTVLRDLNTLEEAGFPLYDEFIEGRKVWRLVTPLRKLL